MARSTSIKYEPLSTTSPTQDAYCIQPLPSQRKFARTRLILSAIACLCFLVSACLVITWTGIPLQPTNYDIRTIKSSRPLQPPGPPQSDLSRQRQKQIRDSFQLAYEKFVTYAGDHDEIRPTSLGHSDPRNGWGATTVDSMTTLFVMGLEDHLQAAINHTVHTDFTRSRVPGQHTSVFETNIRYLGGILSTYELTGTNHTELLDKAVDIANELEVAWSGSSKIPHPAVSVDDNHAVYHHDTTLAEAGSLTLEFDRLSYWTGNDSYRLTADSTSRALMSNPQVFPGLHAQNIYLYTGLPQGDYVGWGGGSDSFYEYAVKYWQLIGDQAVDYVKYWQEAVISSRKHLLRWSEDHKHPYLTEFSASGGGTRNFMTHLACFAPGNWMLGGKLLEKDDIFALGLKLAETCYDSYNSTNSGLGPDKFSYDKSLVVLKGEFLMRPEVLESMWYAWRLTGDPVWQERAWLIFEAIERTCKVEGGYRGLRNVEQPGWGSIDSSESFVFAETFKYLYLMFSPRSHFSLDEWVFTTEAHPFKIRVSNTVPMETPSLTKHTGNSNNQA